MADVKRAVRVAERIREELALLIANTVKDPRARGVVVSRVEMPDDLRSARIYIRLLEGGDEEQQAAAVAGLTRAAPLLRREITAAARLRYAPELRFYYDEGYEKALRIEEILHEIHGSPAKIGAKKSTKKK